MLLLPLAGCSTLGANGPNARAIAHADKAMVANVPITVIDVNDAVAHRVLAAHGTQLFSQILGDAPPTGSIIGPGDVLQVNIWEAPPAVLFGGNTSFGTGDTESILAGATVVEQKASLPDMTVDETGRIRVPFAGSIQAAGRTPQQLERAIAGALAGKAHDPQVAVAISRNTSSTVNIGGEVANNTRIPLVPGNERLLDIIAAAGGVRQPPNKVTIQVSRQGRTAYLPLSTVISNPAENIRLGPNDVVTALFQPFSFTALGSTSTSAEIPFEATGISLAEAIARAGGLKDDRADIKGVFIFRFEDPKALDPATAAMAYRTPDGRIPIIYRVNMGDPSTLFIAQSFPMQNKDVLYVSHAALTDLQKFTSILSSIAFTVIGLGRAVP